jgi:hypothetical protein
MPPLMVVSAIIGAVGSAIQRGPWVSDHIGSTNGGGTRCRAGSAGNHRQQRRCD